MFSDYDVKYRDTELEVEVDDLTERDAFEDFLEALDNSYCTDNDDCGNYPPARVINFSYGAAEYDISKRAQVRQCKEFMKLGLQGVTSVVASGDYGVASAIWRVLDNNGCIVAGERARSRSWDDEFEDGTVFSPDYPSSCPYVLSVGGTQLPQHQNVSNPESAMQRTFEDMEYNGVTFSSSG